MKASFDFGQLLLARFEDADPNRSTGLDVARLLERFHLGGAVFSTPAKLGSPGAMNDLLAWAGASRHRVPFIALEEGGTVHPLGSFLPGLPSPRSAARKGVGAVEKLGDLIGQGCKIVGFNTNFAPVLDLSESPSDSQSFGSAPLYVAQCARAFLRGMKRHGILACGKHFPGCGELPVVSRTMAQLWREDLVPYRELANQLPLVKISVAACKAYDSPILRPATLSAGVIEGLLRAKLQYEGVAVADISETAAVTDGTTLEEAAVRSLVAGCDLLIVEGREDRIELVIRELLRAVEFGALSAERIGQARKRLQSAKEVVARPATKVPSDALNKLAKQFENFASESAAARGERIA